MPVRIRITLLFSLLVMFILGLVCGSVYLFSYTSRLANIQRKLHNRAISVGGLLSQSEVFSNELIQRIESYTSISFSNRVIQAYDADHRQIYRHSSIPTDSISIGPAIFEEALKKGDVFFKSGNKEAVAHFYKHENHRLFVVVAGEDEEGIQTLRKLFNILTLSFLGGVVTALLGGFFFSKSLLKPIKKIADDANEISTHNLSTRIHTGVVKDEWQYLSNTLNSLLDRLQEGFDLQRRFIGNASHELSTPLTSISSQLEVALQRERAAGEYRAVMKSIHQDVLHMIKLTQTLLEFAKASGTPGGLDISLVRIDEVLLRLPAEIAKANNGHSISFEFDELPPEEDKLLVYGNEELLFTAIRNIVTNACKYSEDHHAAVRLVIEASQILISITDKGAGIPESEFENIFQPFYRVHESRSKEGFGLGLSLAYRIIKLHNGDIAVSSKVSEGTVFTISVPAAGSL
ncbi:HAMP domain-containing histidine kinase [Segetibacter sp. 3557_3]|uniref:HAMP domain-containing sensor histidine kinase n=1 Tax=Segetibacter sp. 3557_3 TaxID=2547429 RepID=UPI00105860AB|nr:HAMP domain-containing sensor histidine kinase [Segetibacter sp. 3557_3]TDH27926.1 HAMP domain-containing histidine kinase [Segetibacter sp. 3557_3]